MKIHLIALIFLSLLGQAEVDQKQLEIKEHQSLLATLFVQSSAEFYTNSVSIYKAAEYQLESAVEDTSFSAAIEQTKNFKGKPPAVILDVDQTVLDNIAFQARKIMDRTFYPDGWDEWCMEEQATYIPGVENFLAKAAKLGVEVFFVTNRTANLEEATKNNLEKLGFKFAKNIDQLLMRYEKETWRSNKNTRREHIAKNYRIVMMIGDNLGDFVDDEENSSAPDIRMAAAQRYNDMWGKYWFMLANPTYGDWESALFNFKYETPKSEQLQIKSQALDVK